MKQFDKLIDKRLQEGVDSVVKNIAKHISGYNSKKDSEFKKFGKLTNPNTVYERDGTWKGNSPFYILVMGSTVFVYSTAGKYIDDATPNVFEGDFGKKIATVHTITGDYKLL